MVRTKVFVGNLDFRTREAELAKAFAVAGKVISANIITRGPRSLGYGFVEFDNEEDAENAVKALNKTDVDGRPINVEVAKLREELQQDQQNQATDANATEGQTSARGGRGGRRGAPRGARGTRGTARGGRGAARGGGFRAKREGGKDEEGQEQSSPAQSSQPQKKREPREPREPREQPDNRTPSKTLLFVANLPFKLDDATFGQIFKDAGVQYKNAYVVKNQRSGRSKGFGFAEFENETDQQKALTAVNNKTVDERTLVVKVALTEAPQQKKAEEVKTTSPAPQAATSPAPQKQ